MIKTVVTTNNDRIPSLRIHLIRGAFGSLSLKLSQTGFSFLLAVLLARLLGVENFGIYAFCISIVNLLVIPAMLGGQNLLVREIASYQTGGNFDLINGLLRWLRKATIAAAIAVSFGAAIISWFIFQESLLRNVFVLALCLVPLLAATNLQNAALRGLNRILLGQASLTLTPVLFIAGIGTFFLLPGFTLTPEAAVITHAASTGLMVLGTGFLLRKYLPKEIKRVEPEHEVPRWIKSMLPFLFAGVIQALNNEASVMILGIMKDAESVGLFRVAQRSAELILFGLLAVNMTIAPTVAELYTKGEKDRLQNIISKSVLLITAFALPVALVLISFGNRLIPLVFGQEYSPAYVPLVILCLGQLFNACIGSVGVILNMIGLERYVTRGITIAAIMNVSLNFILIPHWGTTGAAAATALSLICWNILLALWLHKQTGLVSTFMPKEPGRS